MHNERLFFFVRAASFALVLCGGAMSYSTAAEASKRVLYFTHEPGRWHDYKTQRELFRGIAKEAGWQVTVMTGTHDEQLARLHTPDFGKGFDAIVYNFCFAHARDLKAADNLMVQTREHGVPAMLVHCAMHSWWDTYKTGEEGALGPDYQGQGKADPELVAKWRADHPDRPFPVWGDFTGIASTQHGPQAPIEMVKVADHPATRRFTESVTTGDTELYNNVYSSEKAVPLIRGKQGDQEFFVMWEFPQGKSRVMCLTIGHDVNDWMNRSFQNLMIDGVNYLMER